MSNENARKLLRQSADALSTAGRELNTQGELLRSLTLAVQALTEAALDEPVTIPEWVNEGRQVRTAVDEYNDKLRERIGAALDEPPAIPEEDYPVTIARNHFRDHSRGV